MALLVDSSVWIAGTEVKRPECLRLKRLIEKNELIYITRLIQVEVCQGARSEDEFHRLWDSLLGFEFLEPETRHWGTSAWNYFRCRKKGLTLSTIDCLIATLSREFGVALWTLDKNLIKAQPILGFEIYS